MSVTDSVLSTLGGYDEEEDDFPTGAVEEYDEPLYLPVVGMSIPVPKSYGSLIKKLHDDTKETYEVDHEKWDRAMELYRQCGDEGIDNDKYTYAHHFEHPADENIIRQNIKNIMRSTYMQNPKIEFTDIGTEELAESLEYILDFILNKTAYPGVNFKPKARRWILHGQLTNFGIIRLDWQPHEGSAQQAVEELKKLEKELSTKGIDRKTVKEIYAKLERLHASLPLSEQKGMKISNVLPQNLIIDPECTMADLSDAKWVAEDFDMKRVYMEQVYYYKEEDGKLCMRSNSNATTEAVDSSVAEDVKAKVIDIVLHHRTEEQTDLLAADTVRCVYYYDKLLRRISLFNTEDWSHPLWVSDDDMGLSRFFRHFILSFGEPVDGVIQPGEVSYYVGQANEINRINRKIKNIRDVVFNTLVYNRRAVDPKEVQKLVRHLRNPKQVSAFGIGNDGDKKIGELLEALIPPMAQFKELFDETQLRAKVDRAANINPIDSGQQFKTNTTNDAISTYTQNKQETTGVNIDIIEDAVSELAWSMSELLVSKYTTEEIVAMVGAVKAKGFTPMSVTEFNQTYRMEIAAGSIEKPTTQFKKQEAVQIAQAIGQVGQAAPGTTLTIMMRMFKEAFSNFLVTKEDWASLTAESQANLQKGISTNGPAQPGQPQPPPQQPGPGA